MTRFRNLAILAVIAALAVTGLLLSGKHRPGKNPETADGSSPLTMVEAPPVTQEIPAPAPAAPERAATQPAAPAPTEQPPQPIAASNAPDPQAAPNPVQTPLQRDLAVNAALGNWTNILARIRSGELDPNTVLVPGTGNNLLRLAIIKQNVEVVMELLAAGAKPGLTEVNAAAITGNLDVLQQLAAAGAPTGGWDQATGRSPFVEAIRRNNLAMADWLLQQGVSTQPSPAGISAGLTPLDEAVWSGSAVMTIQYLESKGFTLNKNHLSMISSSNPHAEELRNYIISRVGN